MFRHISRYRNLLASEIHGSPDRILQDELWRRGSDIVSSHFARSTQRIAGEYPGPWQTPRPSMIFAISRLPPGMAEFGRSSSGVGLPAAVLRC
jgi:hypothetical protein